MSDVLTQGILAGAIEVHRTLGPGLLESVYEVCLAHELRLRELRVTQQVPVPVRYKGVALECGYRLDLLVNDEVIVELKSVKSLDPVHTAQMMTYLRLMGLKRGLLLNFGAKVLRDGIVRVSV